MSPYLKRLAMLLLSLSVTQAGVAVAQFGSNPYIRFEFDEFVPIDALTHYDTHRLVVDKPVKELSVWMISDGGAELGGEHKPGTEVLLDLSGASVIHQTNNDHELSFSAIFDTQLDPGYYPVTKVVFGDAEGYVHGTTAGASGMFTDGTFFDIVQDVSFIPEPASALLLAAASCVLATQRRVRRG